VVTQTSERRDRRERLLGPAYAATTIGMFALCALVAFEATAVTTVMPTVAADLHGLGLYAASFSAPLASGVVGMVAAGAWADRRGPRAPLAVALALFSLGLGVCGLAPSMEVLVGGRVLQGLGGGALTVCLYVLVGLVYPPALRPGVFASFAAAWVLPSMFGPALAALVASTAGWRWVFLGVVGLVVLAAAMMASSLRRLAPAAGGDPTPASRIAWAVAAAVAVLTLELLGSAHGVATALAVLAVAAVVVALRHLLPRGTLVAGPGLPAVVATRGLLSGGFFCIEAYIVFVLEDRWGLSPGVAGLVLTGVGVTWASASQGQARLGGRVGHRTAMSAGALLLLTGVVVILVVVATRAHPVLAMAGAVLAGCGMGFGYPRTGVSMLEASTDRDRGFNSSALSVADSLGAALALSASGVVFSSAHRTGGDPFVTVFALAAAIAVVAALAARRTALPPRHDA
jgi:MFS family permease